MSDQLSKEQMIELCSAMYQGCELQLAIESGQIKTLDDVYQAVALRSDAIEEQLEAAGLSVKPRNRRWRLVFEKRKHWQQLRRD
ncbi:hypothetical protein [Undibacterium sp. TC9W]|uniref:hypothetical protein n=1 Tax=Undibacterium sp. TC9W TaxID=3413053 RepID=UPI003BF10DAA